MKLPFETVTNSPQETESVGTLLASYIASNADAPRFAAMYGNLGVGKTAFVRGFCAELCPNSTVKSPTFALVNEYRCSVPSAGIKKICHFDMYRVTDEDDLYSIGFYDYLRDDCLCIAEWCELIPYALPEEYIKVEIGKVGLDDRRIIKIDLIINN